MANVILPNGWQPRLDQMKLWHYLENGGTRAVEVAHRRWGKDDVALHYTAVASQQRIGNYWHMLPQYAQARKSVWDAVNPRTGMRRIDEAFPHDMRADLRNNDMFIRFKNGSTWQLVGSDNFNALVGSPPIGLVNSEYALADPRAWAYLSPIVDENGGWSLFIYTPRGENHGRTMFRFAEAEPSWFAETLTAAQTPVFTAEQLDRIKRELQAVFGVNEGEALYLQEYFCSFEGMVPGAYYAKQMIDAKRNGRITDVPWVPNSEVYTFWDLGVDDSMTIWFAQIIGAQFRFIDYYENSGLGLSHYAKVLKEKEYVYGDHYMPHDAAVREMTNDDIAKSRKEVAIALGIRPIVITQRPRDITAVLSGIEAARNLLPQCWFDKRKCQQGISALEGYHAEYDDEKKKLGNRPVHDWTSHAAEAFRTFAVGFKVRAKARVVTVTQILDQVSRPGLF